MRNSDIPENEGIYAYDLLTGEYTALPTNAVRIVLDGRLYEVRVKGSVLLISDTSALGGVGQLHVMPQITNVVELKTIKD